jgi:polysaccharide pyruvyl transferase WcaK-like protein
VESIVNITIPEVETGMAFTLSRIKNALKLSPVVLIKKALAKIDDRKNHDKYLAGQRAKEKSFREFSEKYMHETDFIVSQKNIPTNLGERYDYVVVGSDQIWNPKIRYGSSIDFLTFAPQNKRIALAPSFGISTIPEKYSSKYAQWISEMAFLSVREQAGADIIKKLTGIDAPVHIDPTLMLTKQQWLSIAEKSKEKPTEKYLLTYFIGAVSKKRKKFLKDLATKNNLKLVQMASLDDIKRYDANPGEFIDYIASSSLVCTDSFHAIIFSMQMERPFVVFDREGKSAVMSSRIDTLLSKFKFESRKLNNLIISGEYFNIDYTHLSEILDLERKKVMEYLNTALEIKKIK